MRWSTGINIPRPFILGILLILLRLCSFVAGQANNATCLSLKNSQTCQNFSSASISTGLTTDFPFLQFVSNVQEFDTLFTTYIQQDYAKLYLFMAKLITGKNTLIYYNVKDLILQTRAFITLDLRRLCYVLKSCRNQSPLADLVLPMRTFLLLIIITDVDHLFVRVRVLISRQVRKYLR